MEENKAHKLARIIVQVRLKSVSDEDRAYLNDWLDESTGNRAVYRRIVRGECIAERLRMEEKIRNTENYCQVRDQIVRMLKNGRRHRLLRRITWGGMAAACVAGALLYLAPLRPQEGDVPVDAPVRQLLVAALPEEDYEALLVLGDGSTVDLAAQAQDIRQENMVIVGEEGKLLYREEERQPEEEETVLLNKIMTGKKGYALALSDGTQIWLNESSELEYPVRFTGRERVVTLRGEAYFEVAADSARPFIVKTASLCTRVLGTAFNIKAYPEEGTVSATLLSGKVEVSLPEAEGAATVRTTLVPGMQARVDVREDEIVIRKVIAEDAIAWRRGEYIFTDEDMLSVLHTLSRWFGVDFIRETGETPYTFNGIVTRDDRLSSVLEMLTMAGGPRFVIDGDKVYIREK